MDLANVAVADIIRIAAAILAGGLIGFEREMRDKAAGFRTMIFISTGSALFTILSQNLAKDGETSRMAATIISGVGFLGAGAILRDGLHITGLNTAATIWLTAAIGMTMGSGEFIFGAMITTATMLILWAFPPIEHAIDRLIEEHNYEIVIAVDFKKVEAIQDALKYMGLKVMYHRHFKRGGDMICKWGVIGSPQAQEKFILYLIADQDIKEFSY
jgi:putative Mg2+ transporter-C (MgtC) family protein